MGEWTRRPLSDVLDFREGPGILAKDFAESGVPLVRLAGLKRYASLLNGCNWLNESDVERRWKQFRLEAGDALLSTSASLGEVAVADESGVGAVPYTGIIRFRPKDDRIERSFIPYMLMSPNFADQVQAMGVGSVMKHFGPTHLKHMSVAFPERAQQRAIAEVLGALDDKIPANDRSIAAADELAGVTWERSTRDGVVVPLSSVAHFVNGGAFTKDASGTGRVVVRIAELNSGLGGSTVYSDIDVPNERLARPGDLLFAWSGSLTVARWFRPEAIVNQHIFKVIPKDGYPMWLANQAVRTKLAEFKAIAADKATTMGHIQRRHLDEPVAIPTDAEIHRLDGLMAALWHRALAAEQENLTLAATRDQLLPLLMSGKLRVPDAEKVVEEMT